MRSGLMMICLICSANVFASGYRVSEMPDQEVLIKQAGQLTELVIQEFYEGPDQPAGFYQRLQKILESSLDLPGFARRVMGKYYGESTERQKIRFRSAFSHHLMRMYAQSLAGSYDHRVQVSLPYSRHPAPEQMLVHLIISDENGDQTLIDQSLYFSEEEGRWIVQNVIAGGLNIGSLFRECFYKAVADNNRDISAAIDDWDVEIGVSVPRFQPLIQSSDS